MTANLVEFDIQGGLLRYPNKIAEFICLLLINAYKIIGSIFEHNFLKRMTYYYRWKQSGQNKIIIVGSGIWFSSFNTLALIGIIEVRSSE